MVWSLYKTQPSFVLGFHGCDRSVGEAVLAGGEHLKASTNDYDWLGEGIYFWENSPHRAALWAESVHARRPDVVKEPFVVGAIIDLGLCCDLTDSDSLSEVADAFELLRVALRGQGAEVPKNIGNTRERLLRRRDRAVIEFMHFSRAQSALLSYDTMRAPFTEGGALYEDAGFCELTHIQLAVRNTDCIKGYFRPIKK